MYGGFVEDDLLPVFYVIVVTGVLLRQLETPSVIRT